MKKAKNECLITVELRPVLGKKHRPNLVKIISLDWLKWLLRYKKKHRAGEVIGVQECAPTKNTTKKDHGAESQDKPARPEASAPPKSGQPTKEAVEFAAELANLVGYRQAATPKAWRDADPPQVVQVWLNELAGNGRPIEALRTVATTVMRRKRLLSDASPPYSPRYFSAEVKKLVARSRLQPTRDPARRVA